MSKRISTAFTLLSLEALSVITACGPIVIPADPCGENDGVLEGGLSLVDDLYYDDEGQAFAELGDGTIEKCTKITGGLGLSGDIAHLNDFDNLEEVGGIRYGRVLLPETIVAEGTTSERVCSELGPFPSLRRIEDQISNGGGNPRCVVNGMFVSLEHVGGDFNCGGGGDSGLALKYVRDALSCGRTEYPNLEYVGEVFGMSSAPRLKVAGSIDVLVSTDGSVNFPMLEEVGTISWSRRNVFTEAGLFIEGVRDLEVVNLQSLAVVEGDLIVVGNGVEANGPGDPPLISDSVWAQVAGTEISGRLRICANTYQAESDPCPFDEWCPAVFGDDNIKCCQESSWPDCLDVYGGED